MNTIHNKTVSAALFALGLSAASASARDIVSADLILMEGQEPPGAPGRLVDSLNTPFTNSLGQVGFVGALDDGERFIWLETGIIFFDSEALPIELSGSEGTMGVSDAGGFIYSPSIDGDDGVWTDQGLLAVENTQAPGFPEGTTSTFHSRPRMVASGYAAWIAGFNETGGSSTEGRMLYSSTDGTPDTITVVLRSDDIIEGLAVARPDGIDFDFDFSDDATHHISVLIMETGSTADDLHVYVDGSFVARESHPIPDGTENWAGLDSVGINNAGNYVFTGDTDGDSATDEFVAYNGDIVVREGDTLDGVPLLSSASLRAVSINNLEQVAHIWGISGGNEILFVGDGPDLGASSVALLQIGDLLDFDGDGVGDAEVTDFNASASIGPGLDLADDGDVSIELDVLPVGGEEVEAIVRLNFAGEECPADINDDGVIDVLDLLAILNAWGDCPGCPEDITGDGVVDVLDLLEVLAAWGPCP